MLTEYIITCDLPDNQFGYCITLFFDVAKEAFLKLDNPHKKLHLLKRFKDYTIYFRIDNVLHIIGE